MAILSEELNEKTVVPSKDTNLKISKKTSTTSNTDSSNEVLLATQETTVVNINEKVSENINKPKKRNIKDITKKNTEKKQPKKEKKDVKQKRSLHLSIEGKRKETIEEKTIEDIYDYIQDEPRVIDTSVNQNSPFFYEPSVFEKFNISITSVDNDSNLDEKQELYENTEKSFYTNEIKNNNETVTDETEKVVTEDITSDETVTEEVENTISEVTTSDEAVVEEIENTGSEDATSDEAVVEGVENTGSDEIDEDLLTLDDLIDDTTILEEVADTINTPEPSTAKTISNPIGKFFNSSIPSINSTDENNKGFSKIKKSIFSNISPIFKKFTFEEANMVINGKNNNEIENSIPNIENNKFEEALSPTSLPNELDITAQAISIDIPQDNIIGTQLPNDINYNMDYSNILTQETSVEDNVSIDEEIIDELINNADYLDTDEDFYLEENLDDIDDIDDTDEIEEYETEDDLDEYDLDNTELTENTYNDDTFSIEAYVGIDKISDDEIEEMTQDISEEENTEESDEETSLSPTEFENKFLEDNKDNIESDKTVESTPEENSEITNFSKLLESFNQTISTLSDRIANLESEKIKLINDFENEKNSSIDENINDEDVVEEDLDIPEIEDNIIDENSEDIAIDDIDITDIAEDVNIDDISDLETTIEDDDITDEEITTEDISDSDINIDDLDINDIDLSDIDEISLLEDSELISTDDSISDENTEPSVETFLSDAFLSEKFDDDKKNELLAEVLANENTDEDVDTTNLDDVSLEDFLLENIYEEDLKKLDNPVQNVQTIENFAELSDSSNNEPISDFFTIIDSLSKTIEELEGSPDINNVNNLPNELDESNGKSINILINKDDIFSISILNETYEIVADFDGISVLSENIHISTPKNNFFVKIGDKYIEIHNKKDHFLVNTNFEDVEFANAINNVAFAKKKSKIELNIKEAFKLSSVNNKIELSMLNTSIANMSSSGNSETIDENSICDNRTLLISAETQKVYLPYTIEDVMKKLNSSTEYQTPKEVIENEYTLPLSTFKMPIISRFKEAYRFMRVKEKSSIYAAIDLGLELMFNSNLNPAVIRAAKDLKELNIYLDCLYENEVDKFDCFKIVYKVLPKIQ